MPTVLPSSEATRDLSSPPPFPAAADPNHLSPTHTPRRTPSHTPTHSRSSSRVSLSSASPSPSSPSALSPRNSILRGHSPHTPGSPAHPNGDAQAHTANRDASRDRGRTPRASFLNFSSASITNALKDVEARLRSRSRDMPHLHTSAHSASPSPSTRGHAHSSSLSQAPVAAGGGRGGAGRSRSGSRNRDLSAEGREGRSRTVSAERLRERGVSGGGSLVRGRPRDSVILELEQNAEEDDLLNGGNPYTREIEDAREKSREKDEDLRGQGKEKKGKEKEGRWGRLSALLTGGTVDGEKKEAGDGWREFKKGVRQL